MGKTKKIIDFDGGLRYICPKCGKEQEFIGVFWTAYGFSKVSFSVSEDWKDIDFDKEEIDVRDYEDIETPDNPFCCPSCRETLDAEDIREGFFKWLERLKKEDSEWYAEVIAELL
jgi:hypothetical protein